MPSSYSFLENDIGDALGGIDLGQGTRGLRHLHAAGGIFGQIAQQCGDAVGQRSVLLQQHRRAALDQVLRVAGLVIVDGSGNGTSTLPTPTAHSSARVDAPARQTTRSAQAKASAMSAMNG